MMTDENKPLKVYRGAYAYSHDGNEFAEETFDVIKDSKEMTHTFISQILSRVSTGELLKIDVEFVVGKEWTPKEVTVTKNLGKQTVIEHYLCDTEKNTITYTFTDAEGKKDEVTCSCPPRFTINTPANCCNFIFLLSKKFDINGKNNYTAYSSNNQWVFETPLKQTTLSLHKDNPSSEPIMVGKTSLQGDEYILVTVENDDDNDKKKDNIVLYISKHKSIPYRITDDINDIVIMVKYLNNLDPDQ